MTDQTEPAVFAPAARRRVVALCCAALATLSFTTVGPAMCLPAIAAEMHLDYAHQGLLLSAAMWPFFLAVASAAAADRIGYRAPLLWGAAMQIGGWILAGQARTFPQAMGAFIMLGSGGAVIDALVTPMVCRVYPQHRTRVNNLLHACYPLGVLLTSAIVLAMQMADVPWWWIFRVFGVMCLPYVLVAMTIALPRPSDEPRRRQRARTLLGRPLFIGLMVAMVMAGATEMGPSSWLPTFAAELLTNSSWRQHERLAAGLGLALFGALMAAGRLAASAMAGRIGMRKLMLAATVICAVCLGLAAAPLPRSLAIVCLALTGLGVACLWPTLMAMAGDLFPRSGASMYSVLSTCGALGCAVSPVAIGWIGDATGRLAPAIASLALAPVVAFFVIYFSRSNGSGIVEPIEASSFPSR